MQSIVKQVLSLTKTCPVQKWTELEPLIASSLKSLSKTDLISISTHYGSHQQGSASLWTSLQKETLNHFSTLTQKDFLDILQGFAWANVTYPIDPEFETKMSPPINWALEKQAVKLEEEDPEWVYKTKKELMEKYEQFLDKTDGGKYLDFNDDLFSTGDVKKDSLYKKFKDYILDQSKAKTH